MFIHSILYAKKLLTQLELQNFYSSLAIYGTLILHIVKLTFWKVCHAYSTARATARQNRYQNLLWVSWQSSRVFSQAIERAAESLLFFHALNAIYKSKETRYDFEWQHFDPAYKSRGWVEESTRSHFLRSTKSNGLPNIKLSWIFHPWQKPIDISSDWQNPIKVLLLKD